MGITWANHRGSSVEFNHTAQSVGAPRNSAKFGTEQSMDFRNPFPPHFAGSFWYRGKRPTAAYVRRHKTRITHGGNADIGGFKCEILNLVVPPKDVWAAFNTIVGSLNKGGVLRVYVSRDLGYALPRIDYLTPKGVVATTFEASDFHKVGAGLFFPMKVTQQRFPDNGGLGYRLEYDIESVNEVNRPIPDETFTVVPPPDTSVYR